MKKNYLILIFLGLSFCASSQVNFWIEGGYVSNDLRTSNVDYESKPSFRIGGFIQYDTDVETGIYFSRRGMKLNDFNPRHTGKIEQIDFYTNYVEVIPFSVDMLQKKLFSERLTASISAGFFASYGFGGSGNITIDGETVELKNIYKNQTLTIHGSDYPYEAFKPFDFGVNFGFKFSYRDRFFLRISLSQGLRKVMPYDKRTTFNTNSISLGYMIK